MNFGRNPTLPSGERLINFKCFTPPDRRDIPQTLFNHEPHKVRLVRRSNPLESLIYTDGACKNNGHPNTKGGWAFICSFRYLTSGGKGVSGPLEDAGPLM